LLYTAVVAAAALPDLPPAGAPTVSSPPMPVLSRLRKPSSQPGPGWPCPGWLVERACRRGRGSRSGRRGLGVHRRALTRVHPLAELLQHLLVERRDVVGLAARDDAVVDDDLLVDPVAAGVPDVCLQCRPRRERPPPGGAGLDEHPRPVADHGERLLRLDEVADEADGILVAAQ